MIVYTVMRVAGADERLMGVYYLDTRAMVLAKKVFAECGHVRIDAWDTSTQNHSQLLELKV